MMLIWGAAGCERHKTPRAEAEAALCFTLPPGAADIQVEDSSDFLMEHRIVSFTLPASELATVVPRLPCRPSATETLDFMSTMDPPGPGEQVCETGKFNDFEAVKLSPVEGERVRVFVEKFAG